MKKLSFLLFISVLFWSCASFQQYTSHNTEYISEPKLNEPTKRNIGDSLVVQGFSVKTKGVVILKDSSNGFVKKGEYPVSLANSTTLRFFGNGISGNKGFANNYFLDYDLQTKKLYHTYTSGVANVTYKISEIKDFKLTDVILNDSDSFQQTLIYLGKSGNILKFGYREFYQNFARPAFSNEVTYDLTESDVIGYKNLQLKVISATNTEITYTVLSYFN